MNKYLTVGLAVAVVLCLAGCSAQMTKEKAAEKYLETVCPVNIALPKIGEANATGDVEKVKAAALEVQAEFIKARDVFADASIQWPADVAKLIPKVIEYDQAWIDYFEEAQGLQAIDDGSSIEPGAATKNKSGIKIREALGLPTDQEAIDAGCKSFQ